MIDLMMMASIGLERLAWTGQVGGLQAELQAKNVISEVITRDDFSSGAGGTTPTSPLFLNCPNGRKDYLAPDGLELPDGSRWAMFEPFCYPDHFIVQRPNGALERWDVGSNEGDCMPFRVRIENNVAVRMDNGAEVSTVRNRGSCNGSLALLSESGNGDRSGGNSSPNSGGGGGSGVALAVGGIAVVGVAAYFLSEGGGADDISFAPVLGYSLTESGYAYNYGGRMDFRKNRWHLYWTAEQGGGGLRYESGGSYAGDFWTAQFSEQVSDGAAAYDFSLSAKYGGGVWELSPSYRLHSRFDEEADGGLKGETSNSLNLEGVLQYHRWTLRPAAGFRWESADDFGDNAKFGISAVRNL